MRTDHFDSIAGAATALAESDGPRSGCEAIMAMVARAIDAKIAFVVLRRSDTGFADILAAHGLGAADFRRVESRITKSAAWHTFKIAAPVAIDDLAGDLGLNHLAYAAQTRLLIATPILLAGKPQGLLAAGFSRQSRPNENEVIRFLKVVASLIAQSIKVENLLSEE